MGFEIPEFEKGLEKVEKGLESQQSAGLRRRSRRPDFSLNDDIARVRFMSEEERRNRLAELKSEILGSGIAETVEADETRGLSLDELADFKLRRKK